MKAIIIGTPGKGKTTLANNLKDQYDNLAIISLGPLRSSLGIHEPHKGYETEVSEKNTPFLVNIVDSAMKQHEDFIVEGYGLSPEDAITLGQKHNCPVVLLCHKHTSATSDFSLVRKYDAKDKWTARRSDEYLLKLYAFYKSVENRWIERMLSDAVFTTDLDYTGELRRAYDYIVQHQA